MNLGVSWVLKLLQHVPLSIQTSNDLMGLGNGTCHGLFLGRQDNLSSKGHEHHTTLHTHGLWHGQDALVTTLTSNERESNTSVSGSRLCKSGEMRQGKYDGK